MIKAKNKIAIAPCAWGVWYAQHNNQPQYSQYLEEVNSLNVKWTELGPYGYLGDSQKKLAHRLHKADLKLCAASYAYPFEFFNSQKKLEEFFNDVRRIVQILKENKVKYFILMDDSGFYNTIELDIIKKNYWKSTEMVLCRLSKELNDENIDLLLHPHAGTCIETEAEIKQFFDLTNGDINLCFDIGHHMYSDGDVFEFFREYRDKIDYIHIKNINNKLKIKLQNDGLGVEDIFMNGVMCDLADGDIDIIKFKSLLQELNYDGFIVLEQDRFGCEINSMLPAAKRNIEYWLNQ